MTDYEIMKSTIRAIAEQDKGPSGKLCIRVLEQISAIEVEDRIRIKEAGEKFVQDCLNAA
jgi:hypothetical protein